MILRGNTSLRGFLAIFDLAQVLNLVWIWFKTQYVDAKFLVACSHNAGAISIMGRTPRDYRDFTQPPEFEYAIY
jgi:hypothetical protein